MPLMQAGRHLVTVISTKLGKAGTGKEQIAVEFQNGRGEHATWYGSFSEKALPYTLKALENCDWDGESDGWNVSVLCRKGSIVGHEAEIVLEEEEYQGKARIKVSWVNRVGEGGGGMKEVLSEDAAEAFGRKLARDIALVKGIPPPPDPKPDDYSLDDIPFDSSPAQG
jgi:hypothetical protein